MRMRLAIGALAAMWACCAVCVLTVGAEVLNVRQAPQSPQRPQVRRPEQMAGQPTAQPVYAAKDLCEVAGSVVRAGDGTPLRAATIALVPQGRRVEPLTARTDQAGRFALSGVPPGNYRLMVERAGYARQEYGQRAIGRRGVAMTLAPGQRMSDLLFRMIPAGVVTGHVYDEAGEPVVGVMVNVMRRVYREGQPTFEGGEGDRSDDRGEYRIFNLMPGKYVVSATPVGGLAGFGARRRGGAGGGASVDAAEEMYVPVYYPGVMDAETAQPLEVSAGQELTNIDFTLIPQATVRVRGRVLLTGTNRGNTQVMLVPRSRLGMMRGRSREESVEPDGAFELRGVAPGQYVLAAMHFEENVTFYAREALDVGNADIDGVTLALAQNGTVSGKVTVEGGTLPEEGRIMVTLRTADALSRGGDSRVQPDGAFQVRNVAVGEYQVGVFGAPADYYLKSVRRGNEEFLDRGIPLARDTAGIELVLSPSGARVEGQVLTEENLPASGVTVVLVPAREFRNLRARYRTATTDVTGKFAIRGIAPGEYTLFCWDTDEGDVWMDPEFLAPFEGKGQKARLSEGGAQTVQLTLLAGG